MAQFTIYSKAQCPYCVKAKVLLDSLDHTYDVKDVAEDAKHLQELLRRAPGVRTVPQIFLRDVYIGGYQQLEEMKQNGKLDKLILESEQQEPTV